MNNNPDLARVLRPVPRLMVAASVWLGSLCAVSAGLLAISGGVASAATVTHTWSGADLGNSGSPDWSEAGNWKNGSAPVTGGSPNLNFPVLGCACGANADNDVKNLKVQQLSLALGVETGKGNDYSMNGDALKVGTVDVSSAVPNADNGQNAYFGMPFSLLGPETWSVDIENNTNLDFGTLTGSTSDSLNLDLPVATSGNGGGFINLPSFNAGPLIVTGSGAATSYLTGGNFNGRTDEPVSLNDAGVFVTGPGGTTRATTTTKWGPLTVSGGSIQFGNGGGTGPYGINAVAGALSFNATANVTLNSLEPGTGSTPVAGVDYPQIDATGPVTLGSAQVNLLAACNQAIGTRYTIVNGASVTGTFAGLPNDDVFQAPSDGSASCQAAGAVSPYLEIRYTTTSVTATVVKAPSGAPRTSVDASQRPVLRESAGRFFRAAS
jgi:hypothetical protein